jgi:hypothetical protein
MYLMEQSLTPIYIQVNFHTLAVTESRKTVGKEGLQGKIGIA